MCDLVTERRAAGRLTAKQERTGLNFGWEPKYLISCHRITEPEESLAHLKLLLQEAWKTFSDAGYSDHTVKESVRKSRVLQAACRTVTYLTGLL